MTPILSVVIPVYNSEKYLRQCIDSVLAQKYRDYEVILVNDGSKDKSREICDEYALKNPEITVIHKENGGVTSARKAGILKAKGEYIAFVDSDDWIADDMYEYMMDKANKTNADVILCDIVFEDGSRQIRPNYVEEGFYDKEELEKSIYPRMFFDFEKGCPCINPSLCNKIIRRNTVEKVIATVNEKITFGEDALCTYPVIVNVGSIYVSHEKYYHYRHNPDSVSNRYDRKMLEKFILLGYEFRTLFSKYGFDGESQLKGYVARLSLECIRNELLFNKKESVLKRIKTVKEYLNNSLVEDAFDYSIGEIKDKKVKMKMGMVLKKRVFSLYLLFYFKSIVLNIKKKKS